MLRSNICIFLVFSLSEVVYGNRYVSYIDSLTGSWWDTDILTAWGVPGYSDPYAYNVLNFAFYLSSGSATDALYPWVHPTEYFSAETMSTIAHKSNASDDEFRAGLVTLYHNVGISLLVSCFGGTDMPTANHDAVELGKQIAAFVKKYRFDGVDLDWEDSSTFEDGTGVGEQWLIDITNTLRTDLPLKQGYLLTHAPQAPYFMGKVKYTAGAYLTVHKSVGSSINWYNMQFYNQDDSSYNTYESLFEASNGWASNTSVYQIIDGANDMDVAVTAQKIVVGKPVTDADADNSGWVAANDLESIFAKATANTVIGWNAGFMTWEFKSDQTNSFNFANKVVLGF